MTERESIITNFLSNKRKYENIQGEVDEQGNGAPREVHTSLDEDYPSVVSHILEPSLSKDDMEIPQRIKRKYLDIREDCNEKYVIDECIVATPCPGGSLNDSSQEAHQSNNQDRSIDATALTTAVNESLETAELKDIYNNRIYCETYT